MGLGFGFGLGLGEGVGVGLVNPNPNPNPSPTPGQVNCLFILFCVRNSFSVLPSALHVAAGVAIGVALLAYAVEDSGANNTICLGNVRLV